MFRKSKNRPYQPSRQKLDAAISVILDQAVNVESEKASEHLRALLIKENPLWKLPDRRVARYLKRHLKARKNPLAEEIEADMDEATVYTTMSTQTKTRELENVPPNLNDQITPADKNDNVKVENNKDILLDESGKVEGEEDSDDKKVEDVIEDQGITTIVETDDDAEVGFEFTNDDIGTKTDKNMDKAYVTEKDGSDKDDGLKCFGMSCVIS